MRALANLKLWRATASEKARVLVRAGDDSHDVMAGGARTRIKRSSIEQIILLTDILV